jgi:Asp-tRNA(Asn)/Glu-tRNA(Gln) amidotransferase A subunit family amidase
MILPTAPVTRLARNADQAVLSEYYIKALAITAIAGAVGAPQIHIPTPEGGISLIARQGADRTLIDRAIELAAELAG